MCCFHVVDMLSSPCARTRPVIVVEAFMPLPVSVDRYVALCSDNGLPAVCINATVCFRVHARHFTSSIGEQTLYPCPWLPHSPALWKQPVCLHCVNHYISEGYVCRGTYKQKTVLVLVCVLNSRGRPIMNFNADTDYWRTKKPIPINRPICIYLFGIMTITTILNEHVF